MSNDEYISDRIKVLSTTDSLSITYKQMRVKAIIALLISIFGIFQTFDAIKHYDGLFIIYSILALFAIYTCIANILNKTYIKISKNKLSVTEGPIPWFKSAYSDVHRINELYINPKIYPFGFGSADKRVFDISFRDESNTDHILITRIVDFEEADFIRRQISKTLGIKDDKLKMPM